MSQYHIHIISDSTGETAHSISRACLSQFKEIDREEHLWPLIRSAEQLKEVFQIIESKPGPVLFTMVNPELVTFIISECQRIRVLSLDLIGPTIRQLENYFGHNYSGLPGSQHVLDDEYFKRIDAMQFVLSHDDGQKYDEMEESDVILVGVSRVSKTPTCFYLANKAIRATNIPYVPGIALPEKLFEIKNIPIIGLTCMAQRLIEIRSNRFLKTEKHNLESYTSLDDVKKEILEAKKLFVQNAWPVIDVTKRSIEETASEIIKILNKWKLKHDAA